MKTKQQVQKRLSERLNPLARYLLETGESMTSLMNKASISRNTLRMLLTKAGGSVGPHLFTVAALHLATDGRIDIWGWCRSPTFYRSRYSSRIRDIACRVRQHERLNKKALSGQRDVLAKIRMVTAEDVEKMKVQVRRTRALKRDQTKRDALERALVEGKAFIEGETKEKGTPGPRPSRRYRLDE